MYRNRTICLLKYPLYGTGAAAAGHGDVELVVVLGGGHVCERRLVLGLFPEGRVQVVS